MTVYDACAVMPAATTGIGERRSVYDSGDSKKYKGSRARERVEAVCGSKEGRNRTSGVRKRRRFASFSSKRRDVSRGVRGKARGSRKTKGVEDLYDFRAIFFRNVIYPTRNRFPLSSSTVCAYTRAGKQIDARGYIYIYKRVLCVFVYTEEPEQTLFVRTH